MNLVWTGLQFAAMACTSAFLLLAGCTGGLKSAPSDIQNQIDILTKELAQEENAYYAGRQLGELGMVWQLPPPTIEALRAASLDSTLGFEIADCFYIGGGMTWYENGDGAKIAFLRWKLRDTPEECTRIALLWATYCEDRRGTVIGDLCINELVAIKKEAVVPHLFAAAVLGNWYQRRTAALHLGDYWPMCKPLLILLTKSDNKDVAEIAHRNLLRQGKPLPLDADVGDISGDIPTWTPPGRGWAVRKE